MKQTRLAVIIIIVALLAFFLIKLSFNDHFSLTGYIVSTGDANGNLIIWDENDGGSYGRFDSITFYANFTNSTGEPVTDTQGIVSMNSQVAYSCGDVSAYGDSINMTFNSSNGLWYYTTTHESCYYGNYNFTVNATYSGFEYDLTDDYTVDYGCLDLNLVPPLNFPIFQNEVLCQDSYVNKSVRIVDNVIAPYAVSNIIFDCNVSDITGDGTYEFATVSWSNLGVSNVTIQNCILYNFSYGIRFLNGSDFRAINITGAYGTTGISTEHSTNVLIENVNLSNDLNLGGYSNNVSVRDSSFYEAHLAGPYQVTISNILFDNVSTGDLGNRTLIGICDYLSIFGGGPCSAENITIVNSQFFNNTGGSIGCGNTIKNLNVSNNIFNNTFDLINVGNFGGSVTDSVIYNNSFDNCGAALAFSGYNISIFNNSVNCIIGAGEGNMSIFDNQIYGFTPIPAILDAGGFLINPDSNPLNVLYVENNTIRNAKTSAILGGNRQVFFRNNYFYNVSEGFYITGSSNVYLSNNTIESSTYSILLDNSTVNMQGFNFTNSRINISSNNTPSTINSDGDVLFYLSDNVVLDCSGQWMTGNETNGGIQIYKANNVTVRNCNFINFSNAINAINLTNSTFFQNRVHNSGLGVYFSIIDNINFTRNQIYNSYGMALALQSPIQNSIFVENNFTLNNVSRLVYMLGPDNYNNRFIGNIFANGKAEGLQVQQSNLTFIINNQFFNNSGVGVIVHQSADATAINNTAWGNNESGFYVSSSNYAYFVGNRAYNNNFSGFKIVSDSIDLIFANNTAYNNPDNGFYLGPRSNGTFIGNLVHNTANGGGFTFDSNYSSWIVNNWAYSNAAGFAFWGLGSPNNDRNIIINNTLNNNTVVGMIFIFSTGFNNVSNNRVFNNSGIFGGIYVGAPSLNNSFYNNWIYNNSPIGLGLESNASGNLIYSNSICRNSLYDIANNDSTNLGDNNTCTRVFNWADSGTTGCTARCPVVPTPTPSTERAGGGGASVDVPPYIAKGKILEEMGGIPPGAKVEVVPTEKPAAPKPVVPVVQEKPVQPAAKKFVVPVWLAPLIIAGVVLIILLSVILRHYYGGHKPPAHPPAS